jgi:hypothetical protein
MSLDFQESDLADLPPLKLNPDNATVALKKVRDIQGALAAIGDGVKSDQGLNVELARNVLFVCEHNMADLGKLLGVETDSARDIAQRNAMLREANTKVHELEKKMGAAQSPHDVQAGIAHLAGCIEKWWRYEGFGFVSDFEFGKYGANVKLSCHLHGHFRLLDSPTPLSDKEAKEKWLEHLAESGFVLAKNRGEVVIVDCDQTRATLQKLIQARIPSAHIQAYENQGGAAVIMLRQVKIFVKDITELANLPLDPNPSEDD